MSAGKQPSQQRASAASRLRTSHLAIVVDRKLLLITLELCPIDIAFMVILQQNLPLRKRFAVPIALAGASIDDLSALLTFAVGVGASVEWVLEHSNHVAVPDRRPLEGDQLLAIGWSREVDLVGPQRQQRLSRAHQFAEASEDQAYDFLEPQVRIEAETDLAMPDVADRHADAQLAAPRFGAGGVEHAGT